MNLTYKQFLDLVERFPRKSFIIVNKGKATTGVPKRRHGEDIHFKCCIKVIVKAFVAYPESRFGGNKPLVIRDKQADTGQQLIMI